MKLFLIIMTIAHTSSAQDGIPSAPSLNLQPKTTNPMASMLPELTLAAKPSKLPRAMAQRARFLPKDYVADLKKAPLFAKTVAGTVQLLFMEQFPALENNGFGIVRLTLEPCAVHLPHYHPRATEIFYLVEGEVRAGFLEEDGKLVVQESLKAGQVTFFPQGLIHFVQNLGCDKVEFVNAFNSDDAGVVFVLSNVFGIPTDAMQAALDLPAEQVKLIKSGLAPDPVKGTPECLKKCKESADKKDKKNRH